VLEEEFGRFRAAAAVFNGETRLAIVMLEKDGDLAVA
jgi:hypothetical protein